MPLFIDRHAPADAIPAPIRHQLQREARHSTVDAHGVRAIGHWVEDGTIYCLLEAPDGEAVRRHHAARALACVDLHAITLPVAADQRDALRAVIAELWPRRPQPAAG